MTKRDVCGVARARFREWERNKTKRPSAEGVKKAVRVRDF